MILCCDVDGVLADFILGFYRLAEIVLEREIPRVTTLQHKTWSDFEGLTKKEVDKVWEAIKASDNFWLTLPSLVYHPVFQKLDRLSILEKVYFVTTRFGQRVLDQTWRWLRLHGIQQPNVIITKQKGLVAQGVEATHFIDDKPENIEKVLQHSPSTKCFLVEQLSNVEYINKNITRIRLDEIFKILDLSATEHDRQ